MGLLGNRERPPKEPTVRQRLEAFVARARVPKGLTLDALSDGLTPQTCLDAGRCYPPEKVVEDAFEVYFKASETLRRTGTTSQAAVPGCTSELLALVHPAGARAREPRGRAREEEERPRDLARVGAAEAAGELRARALAP